MTTTEITARIEALNGLISAGAVAGTDITGFVTEKKGLQDKLAEANTLPDQTGNVGDELLKPYAVKAEDFERELNAFNTKIGGRLVMSGLGLTDGEYHFATADTALFKGFQGVESKKDPNKPQRYTLSFLAGTATGNGIAPTKFDLVTKLFVVGAEMAISAKPNTGYKVTIKTGRVVTFTEALVGAEV